MEMIAQRESHPVNLLTARWRALIDQQHRYPTGLVGRWIGEKMVRQHAPETAWTVEQLQLQPQERVLEIGFGAGRGLAVAAQQTTRGTVTGIDLSAIMVRVTQRRNQIAVRAGLVSVLQDDIAALPFTTAHFDKIFTIHTCYFWPHPLQIFADLLRILKPDGRLMVTLSSGRTLPTGERIYTPLHQKLIERIVPALQRLDIRRVEFQIGPDSRQYNNVAVLIEK